LEGKEFLQIKNEQFPYQKKHIALAGC